MHEPRVAPLQPHELDDAQRAYLAQFTDAKGRYPNIFGVLSRNMALLDAWTGFGLYTMRGSRLDPVLREVLILRTAINAGSDYEWHQHERIGSKLGMTAAQLEAVRSGTSGGDADFDLMVRCADDLARDDKLSDGAWAAVTERFGVEYTIDAIFTVGAYAALAMALNSCGVQIEARGGSAAVQGAGHVSVGDQ